MFPKSTTSKPYTIIHNNKWKTIDMEGNYRSDSMYPSYILTFILLYDIFNSMLPYNVSISILNHKFSFTTWHPNFQVTLLYLNFLFAFLCLIITTESIAFATTTAPRIRNWHLDDLWRTRSKESSYSREPIPRNFTTKNPNNLKRYHGSYIKYSPVRRWKQWDPQIQHSHLPDNPGP